MEKLCGWRKIFQPACESLQRQGEGTVRALFRFGKWRERQGERPANRDGEAPAKPRADVEHDFNLETCPTRSLVEALVTVLSLCPSRLCGASHTANHGGSMNTEDVNESEWKLRYSDKTPKTTSQCFFTKD